MNRKVLHSAVFALTIILLSFISYFYHLSSADILTETVILQPGFAGIDATIRSIMVDYNDPNGILGIGRISGGGMNPAWRSLIKFDLSSIPPVATINSATLSLYVFDDNTYINPSLGSNPITLEVNKINQDWQENTVTWSNQPTHDPSGITQSISQEGQWYDLDLRALVSLWLASPNSNFGILLKASDESNPPNIWLINSSDSVANQPKLTISYSQVDDTPPLPPPPPPPPPQDTQAPVISNILAINITQNQGTISWQTNENATSQIEYSSQSGNYSIQTVLDSNLVAAHSQTLSSLMPNTSIYYRIKSQDSSGNLTSSPEKTFQTLANLSADQPDTGSDNDTGNNQDGNNELNNPGNGSNTDSSQDSKNSNNFENDASDQSNANILSSDSSTGQNRRATPTSLIDSPSREDTAGSNDDQKGNLITFPIKIVKEVAKNNPPLETVALVAAALVAFLTAGSTISSQPLISNLTERLFVALHRLIAYLLSFFQIKRIKSKVRGKGLALSSETGQPIAQAQVIIQDPLTGKKIWSELTDSTGKFSFNIQNDVQGELTIRANNFQTIHSKFKGNQAFIIHLKPEIVGQEYFDSLSLRLQFGRFFASLRKSILILGAISWLISLTGKIDTLILLLGIFYSLSWLLEILYITRPKVIGAITNSQNRLLNKQAFISVTRSRSEAVVARTCTKKDGSFRLSVPEGEYNINIKAKGFRAKDLYGITVQDKKFDLHQVALESLSVI